MTSDDAAAFLKLALILLFFAVPFAMPCTGACTPSNDAQATLEKSGFTNIETGDYAWFECGEDAFSVVFTAVNPAGQPASGVVCCGWWKSCTVRF